MTDRPLTPKELKLRFENTSNTKAVRFGESFEPGEVHSAPMDRIRKTDLDNLTQLEFLGYEYDGDLFELAPQNKEGSSPKEEDSTEEEPLGEEELELDEGLFEETPVEEISLTEVDGIGQATEDSIKEWLKEEGLETVEDVLGLDDLTELPEIGDTTKDDLREHLESV